MLLVGHHHGAIGVGDVGGQLRPPPGGVEAHGDRPVDEAGPDEEEELGDVVEQDAHVRDASAGVGGQPFGVLAHGGHGLGPRPAPALEDDPAPGIAGPRRHQLGGGLRGSGSPGVGGHGAKRTGARVIWRNRVEGARSTGPQIS